MVEGLTVAMDWYDIEIEDAIATTPRSLVVRRCFDVAPGSFDPSCGGNVLRSNGALVQVSSGSGNENDITTAGLDIDIAYNTELSNFNDSLRGNLDVSFLLNYLDEWDLISNSTGAVDDRLGEVLYPEIRYTSTVTYSLDDLSVVWRMRYWDDVVDSTEPELLSDNAAYAVAPDGNGGFNLTGFAQSENKVENVFYHDLRGAYDVTDNINVYFGINNLFDEEPPRALTQFSNYGSTGINTAPEAYDVIGRRYYAGVTVDL
jgi:outer membrane receptor protein involved in Fe transport